MAERTLLCNFEGVKPNITIVAVVLLAVLSCGSSHQTRPDRAMRVQLRTIQPLLLKTEKVDSCLTVLQTMDTAALKRPADRARWSLLYAMALDKNYIDTTDLSVLAPAVERYTPWHHLSRKDKFYTWYYKARIEENAHRYDASLDSYLHAERYMGATNDVYRTRLYFGMERVYGKTMSRNLAYDAGVKALTYARQSQNYFNYGVALTDCISNAAITSKHGQALIFKNEYDSNKSLFPSRCGSLYNISMVIYFAAIGNVDSLKYYLDAYSGFNDDRELLVRAVAFIKLKEYDQAHKCLEEYAMIVPETEQAYSFYGCRADVRKNQGDLSGALEDLEKKSRLLSETYIYNLDRELSEYESQYHAKLKQANLLFGFGAFLIVLMIALFLYMRFNRQRSALLLAQTEDYRLIYNRVLGLASAEGKKEIRKKDSISDLAKTLESFGSNLRGGEVASLRGAILNMVKIVGTKKAVDMVALFAAVDCNKMFKKLHDFALTDFEIGYCFLLLLGMSSNELNGLLNRGNLRNVSLEIRKKLFITSKEQSLHGYLKAIYEGM